MSVLADKSLVIIGGTSGLGLSAAKAMVGAGARIVAVGRQRDKVAAVEAELGQHCVGCVADATDPASATAAIEIALERFGGFHGLYHVAGGSGRRHGDGPLHELTDEGWEFTLNENLTSLFYSNRAAVRQFLKQKRGGSVLNMGSVLGFSPAPHYFSTHAYVAAKAAIIGFTRSIAASYAADGIRCNVLAPALVATPMSQRAQTDDAIREYVAARQPLLESGIGMPSDLDGAVIFFMGDQSRFVTGQVLAVDGGWSVSDGRRLTP